MKFVRCRRFEYLVKAGSISNYSFSLVDEDRVGLLEFLFETASYPAERAELIAAACGSLAGCTEEACATTIDRLVELEVFEHVGTPDARRTRVLAISDEASHAIVAKRFAQQGYDVRFAPSHVSEPGGSTLDIAEFLGNGVDYVLVTSAAFSPDLFYRANAACIDAGVPLVIAYLDGREGVIVPLVDVDKVGCYNDFELLRESSFFNLLEYQMMKEDLLNGGVGSITDPLHLSALIDQTLLLLNHYRAFTSINYYAYSLDFERLVSTKTRLLKFPKCPSCQGDRNLAHPFI
jgi:hypothetical protein